MHVFGVLERVFGIQYSGFGIWYFVPPGVSTLFEEGRQIVWKQTKRLTAN